MKKNTLLAATLLLSGMISAHAGVTNGNLEKNLLSDSTRVFNLDEINVNAQPKDVFRLRNQPLSSSIFSSQDIRSLNVNDLRDLASYVPSFAMPNYGSRLTSSMYVRGIGSRVNSPAVGLYLDNMPIMGKSTLNFHTYEVDRIDVLRGPQGTLYGQNTEGGLIRIYSKNPMNYQGTDVRLGYGTYGYRSVEAAHYNKVNDQFGFSVAGFYNGSNGFFRNAFDNGRADNFDEAGGKTMLVWRPTTRWNIQLLGDYQYTKQHAFPYGLLDQTTGITADPNINHQGEYQRNMVNSSLNVTFKGNYFDFNSTSTYQYLKDYMLMDLDYLPQDFMHLDQRQLQNSYTQEFVLKSNRPSCWHWTTGAFFSGQWLKTNSPVYFSDGITAPIGQAIQSAMYNAMLNAMVAGMVKAGMPQQVAQQMAAKTIADAGGVSMDVTMGAPGLFHTPQFNVGFFHESNVNITDRLTATLGLRYDYSFVKVQYDASAYMNLTANVMGQTATNSLVSELNHQTSNEYEQLLPKFGLNYRLDDLGSNVYALVSKGYRAGGFNIQMFSDILNADLNANSNKAMRSSYTVPHTEQDYDNVNKTISYKPETSWNYELGTHINLFNGNMLFDLSTYYMEVKNQQLSVMAGNYGFGRMMVNAGKSHSCGVETTLRGNAFNERLAWSLSYGYTHAVFDSYTDKVMINNILTDVDYKNKQVPFVPQHTFAAMADYRFDVSSSMLKAIVLGANVSGCGNIYWDEANLYNQKLYATLGAHADAEFGKVVLRVWGKNLTDTRYNAFAFQSGATGQQLTFAQRGNPLQFGVDVKFHL